MSVGFVVNPRMRGLAYISLMPARSAPSAKSFTFRRGSLGMLTVSLVIEFEYAGTGFFQRAHDEVGVGRPTFRVLVVDKKTATAGGLAGGHVAPAVADHV